MSNQGTSHGDAYGNYGYGDTSEWRGGHKRYHEDGGGGHGGGYKRGRYEEDGGSFRGRGGGRGGGPYKGKNPAQWMQDQQHFFEAEPRGESRGPYSNDRSDGKGGGKGGHILSPPSQSVIFLGLPITVDSEQLRTYLESLGAVIDSTVIIVDKMTGLSKRFGFAKFGSVEHARSFVEPNYPYVEWPDELGETCRVKIDYSQSQEKGPRGVLVGSHGQGILRPIAGTEEMGSDGMLDRSLIVNDGIRDIGAQPSSVLLVRGLDALTTDEEICDSILGISQLEAIRKGGLQQIRVIKDKMTRASWGYCFLVFSDVQLASQVLGFILNPQAYPTGFRVRHSPVAVSFSHQHSFIPVYGYTDQSFTFKGTMLRYWDEKAMTSIKNLVEEIPAAKTTAPAEDDDDLAALLDSIDDLPPPPVVPTKEIEPLSIDITGGTKSAVPIGPEIPIKTSSQPPPPQVQMPTPPPPPPTHSETKAEKMQPIKFAKTEHASDGPTGTKMSEKKIKPITGEKEQMVGARKTAATISKWNTKKQELASKPITGSSSGGKAKGSITNSISSTNSTPLGSALDDDFEFADVAKISCLLCLRQFKTLPELKKHNDVSTLHKSNLQDDSKVIAAKTRKSNVAPKADQPKYRDRASERREAYGQPDKPEVESKSSSKRQEKAPSPPVQPNKDGIEDSNKGSKMLEAMGWNKGQGLGNTQNGRVDPVMAYAHAQGVGLGAVKPTLAGQYEDSAKGYSQRSRDKARERFEGTS